MSDIHQILQKYWGYSVFRPLQEEIIQSVLDKSDTLALMPTGGGKSICFQVPALAQQGICLVISPLIALMKDQVENLAQRGIPALCIYSGMTYVEIKKTLNNAAYGNYKFLYLSPERLETELFREYLPALPVNLLAVDEAHCISQWGYDFRPSYLRITQLRESLPDVPVLALTASATTQVQDDICDKLAFAKNHHRFKKSFARPNLSYSAFNTESKYNKLLDIIKNVGGSGIVYCRSRKHTMDISELLNKRSISSSFYHAGLSHEIRNQRQESWIKGQTRVMVCTNAFGMGIDKPDVRFVVHFDMPDCMENYYQEAGRAGRDEKRAYAVLLYTGGEPYELQKQVDIRFPGIEQLTMLYQHLMNYLQVAAGGGEGNTYPFDMGAFAKNFKLDILSTNHTLKALEQQGLISLNESFFQPSKLVFTCNRENLDELERTHPELSILTKALLRSYGGIFDFHCNIFEMKLAAFTKQDPALVKQQLIQLHQLHIVDYSPQLEGSRITLLQNRMYNSNLHFDMQLLTNRKKQYQSGLNEIISYITNPDICRSKMIGSYFSDSTVIDCGVCDNCINRKSKRLDIESFNMIAKNILSGNYGLQINEIFNRGKEHKKEHLWQVLNYLKAENKINFNNSGEIKILN